MSSLTTFVANLAGSVKWATVRSGAIARDVTLGDLVIHEKSICKSPYQFSASITLHSLSLTIASVVIRAPTLVTRCRTGTTGKASPEATGKASARQHTTTAKTGYSL